MTVNTPYIHVLRFEVTLDDRALLAFLRANTSLFLLSRDVVDSDLLRRELVRLAAFEALVNGGHGVRRFLPEMQQRSLKSRAEMN